MNHDKTVEYVKPVNPQSNTLAAVGASLGGVANANQFGYVNPAAQFVAPAVAQL